jgi:hypothetical protein
MKVNINGVEIVVDGDANIEILGKMITVKPKRALIPKIPDAIPMPAPARKKFPGWPDSWVDRFRRSDWEEWSGAPRAIC